jgi:hypothetical protein
MPESVPALFNTIRRVVDEFGGPPELASALCTEIGEEFLAAVYDQARESFQLDEQPHGRLGMTEVEASLRWCPHVREHTPVGKGTKDVAIGNRYQSGRLPLHRIDVLGVALDRSATGLLRPSWAADLSADQRTATGPTPESVGAADRQRASGSVRR